MTGNVDKVDNHTSTFVEKIPPSSGKGRYHTHDNIGFPAHILNRCLEELRILCLWRERHGKSREQNSSCWNELARLHLWGEYFEDSKLEKALQPSDRLSVTVLKLLSGIAEAILSLSLKSAAELYTRPPSSDLPSLVEKARLIVANNKNHSQNHNEDEINRIDSDSEGSSIDEESDFCEDMEFNTRCLMQLVPALQKNITYGSMRRNKQLLSSPETFQVSGLAESYVALAREKFQKADMSLVQRLCESNWQRRVRIRDRIYRSEEVVQEISAPVKARAVAQSIFRPTSTFPNSGLETAMSAKSQSAALGVSHTSFVSSIDDRGTTSLRIPPMPSEVNDGKPFQCFLCGTVQFKIRNRIDWKMHVFADLQPYICTFSDCDHELVQFPTRAAWADHEFSHHRFDERWICPECGIEKNCAEDWEKHVDDDHSISFSGPELLIARNMARRSVSRPIEDEECFLCRSSPGQSRRAFVEHVGRHLEEMALLALSQGKKDDSEGLLSGTSQSSNTIETDVENLDPQPSPLYAPYPVKSLCETSPTISSTRPEEDNDLLMKHTVAGEELTSRRFRQGARSGVPYDEAELNSDVEDTHWPHADCETPFKELKEHLVTRHPDRKKLCPVVTCVYHHKGFSRSQDLTRHVNTHYRGTLVCEFCSVSGLDLAMTYNRVDVFKRHLISEHGAAEALSNSRKRILATMSTFDGQHKRCSICSVRFADAQSLYEHLDHCLLSAVTSEISSEPSNEPSAILMRQAQNPICDVDYDKREDDGGSPIQGFRRLASDKDGKDGKDGYLHWSTSPANKHPYTTCSAFRRQEVDRERHYVFMPDGPIEYTASGRRCALCREEDPNKDHLKFHNIFQEVNDSRMQIIPSRRTDFKALLEKHNLSQEDRDRLVDQWCITNKKRAYSCGFCVRLFSTLSERTTHLCQAHFHRGESMNYWDDSNLIRGLLLQPELVEPCRAIFPKDLYASDSVYIWPSTSATKDLQYRLELATETPDELARVAFLTAVSLEETSSSHLTVPTGKFQAASSPSINADPWLTPGQIPILTDGTDDVREADTLPKRLLSDESPIAAHDRSQTLSPMESW